MVLHHISRLHVFPLLLCPICNQGRNTVTDMSREQYETDAFIGLCFPFSTCGT